MEQPRQRTRTSRPDLIIETSVSRLRRITEWIVTIFFWGIIAAYILFVVNSYLSREIEPTAANIFSINSDYGELSYNLLFLYGILFGIFMIVILFWVYINILIGHSISPRYKGLIKVSESVSPEEVADYFQLSTEKASSYRELQWISISPQENITLDKIRHLRRIRK